MKILKKKLIYEKIYVLEKRLEKLRSLIIPNCPRCNKEMVLKTNIYTYDKFWGCHTWPSCWGTRDYPADYLDRGRKLVKDCITCGCMNCTKHQIK